MPLRPLAFVSGLALGDYLLWNWSLNSNHDVLALVSGLSLPPLALACLWLVAVSIARLLTGTARRPGALRARGRREAGSETAASGAEETQAGAPSRKIAA